MDLVKIYAYLNDFALTNKFSSSQKIPLEIRIEGWRLYGLIPLSMSLIGSLGDLLTWVHDEAWAKERFIEKVNGPYLCGQFLTKSKFVSLSKINETTTKEQALQLLGLKGYPDFDKPGNLYVITCEPTSEILHLTKPLVPILYKLEYFFFFFFFLYFFFERKTTIINFFLKKRENGEWKSATDFGDNTIPGFTSGGLSEVVINTFEIEAENIQELAKKGIVCRILPDQ